MNKIILIILIFSLSVSLEAKYKEMLLETKKLTDIEKIEEGEKFFLAEGITYKKIRIDRMYVNIEREQSEIILLKYDLEEGFKNKNKDIKKIELELKDDKMIGKGKVDLPMVGMSNVYLEGHFTVTEDKEIYYKITKATVKSIIPVPQSILDKFSKKLNPIFQIESLEVPLYFTQIIYEKDRIIIR